jgi:hypothetical protein
MHVSDDPRNDARTNAAAGEGQATRTFTEEFRVSGEKVVEKVKELIREGNVRRITLKNEEGRTLIEIPLTIGVIGTLLLPVWAGIGAIAALVANLTIAVERAVPADAEADAPADAPVPAEEGPAT